MSSPDPLRERYDAIVIGARVAGAGTALLLARAGLRVLVLDKTAYASDTLSSHSLMRAGVMQLLRWNVLDRIVSAPTPVIRRTVFHYGADAVAVNFKARDGLVGLVAPRRTVIDPVLADAAREAGAQVRHGTTVRVIHRDLNGRVTGLSFQDASGESHQAAADVVIGADGLNSVVARTVDAEMLCKGAHFGSFIYAYWPGLDLDATHWYFGEQVAAGAIPTNDGMTCVFAGMPPSRFRSRDARGFDRLYREVIAECDPEFGSRLSRSKPGSRYFPFAGRRGFVRQSWGPGWALVGDAGCFKDPLTAHGMTDALRDAEHLARAVATGTEDALAAYQSERDVFAHEFLKLSDAIASFDWDYEQVQELHLRLSKLMGREYDHVCALDAA